MTRRLLQLPIEHQRTILLENIHYQKDIIHDPSAITYDGNLKGFFDLIEIIRKTKGSIYADWMQSIVQTRFFFELGLNYADQIILRGKDGSVLLINRERMVTNNSVYIDLIDIQQKIDSITVSDRKWWWISHLSAFSLGAFTYYLYKSM